MKYIITDNKGNEFKTDDFEQAFYKSFELRSGTITNTETKEVRTFWRGSDSEPQS